MIKQLSLLAGALVLSAACLAKPTIPQGEYKCHIVAVNDSEGVAFVQADSVQDAREALIGAKGFISPVRREPVARVLECVDRRTGELSQATMETLISMLEL